MEIKNGFTLIELLVVIAIMSSLSALLVPNFMGVRERARDSQRKSDLKQIQKALEMYKQDQNPPAYPDELTHADGYTYLPNSGSQWSSGTTIYMNKIPQDPNRTTAHYYYISPKAGSTDPLSYDLCACLENKADSEASVTGNCSANYSCGTAGKYYLLNEP